MIKIISVIKGIEKTEHSGAVHCEENTTKGNMVRIHSVNEL